MVININECNYLEYLYGKFVFVKKGINFFVLSDVVKIELLLEKVKVFFCVE